MNLVKGHSYHLSRIGLLMLLAGLLGASSQAAPAPYSSSGFGEDLFGASATANSRMANATAAINYLAGVLKNSTGEIHSLVNDTLDTISPTLFLFTPQGMVLTAASGVFAGVLTYRFAHYLSDRCGRAMFAAAPDGTHGNDAEMRGRGGSQLAGNGEDIDLEVVVDGRRYGERSDLPQEPVSDEDDRRSQQSACELLSASNRAHDKKNRRTNAAPAYLDHQRSAAAAVAGSASADAPPGSTDTARGSSSN